MNTDTTQPSSPSLKPAEISRPAHTPAAPAENPVATNESSDATHAADLGQEPERIQPRPAEHHPTNDHQYDSGMAREPVTRSDEAASPSIASSETSTFAKATVDEPPNESNVTSVPMAGPMIGISGLAAAIRESNGALSQLLGELATETRQAAAAHGDSLRAIHGAIHELRRAHQEVLSRLNQPQGQ